MTLRPTTAATSPPSQQHHQPQTMSYQFPLPTSSETHLSSFLESLLTSSFPHEVRRELDHLKYLHVQTDQTIEIWRGRQDAVLEMVRAGVLGMRDGWKGGDAATVKDEDTDAAGGGAGTKRKREKNDDSTHDDTENDDHPPKNNESPPIPTTTQILHHLKTHHPQIFSLQSQIDADHSQLQQLSAERQETAYQLQHMMQLALDRLNRDLAVFESELGIVSADTVATTSGAENAVVAPPTVQPVVDTQRHKSIRRASTTSSIQSTHHPSLLSRSNSALPTTTTLQTSSPKNLAAIQITPTSTEWILAKILSYNTSTKQYTLSDEDEKEKLYTLPSSRVVPLSNTPNFTPGELVYAVYPDTTSFYLARISGSGCKNGYWMVSFEEDGDEEGVTHEKAVPVWGVMRVPG